MMSFLYSVTYVAIGSMIGSLLAHALLHCVKVSLK